MPCIFVRNNAALRTVIVSIVEIHLKLEQFEHLLFLDFSVGVSGSDENFPVRNVTAVLGFIILWPSFHLKC